MAKFYGIMGSPRANGNAATLLAQVFNGAAAAGAETASLTVNDTQMRGCQACMQCKSSGTCAVHDDMTGVYAGIDAADVVVFASPIYMGTVTAQLMVVAQRLYAYLGMDFSTRLAPGKTAVLLLTQGNPNAETFAGYVNTLPVMLKHLGFAHVEMLLAPGLGAPDAATQDDALMASAYELGKKLASA